MDRHKKIFFLLIGVPILFVACLAPKQPSNKIEYYTLEYDPPQMGTLGPLAFVIRMERFSVAPTYNSNRIIYRDRSYKREAYAYHRWRDNPGDLVTYFLGRDMKQSGLFNAVLSYDTIFRSSYVLEGTVDEFFEWDKERSWEAILSISIAFVTENEPAMGKRVLFQKIYHAKEPCKRRHPRALAEAMSSAMAEVSGQIIKDIYDYLKDRQ